jgi:hypothetical protein
MRLLMGVRWYVLLLAHHHVAEIDTLQQEQHPNEIPLTTPTPTTDRPRLQSTTGDASTSADPPPSSPPTLLATFLAAANEPTSHALDIIDGEYRTKAASLAKAQQPQLPQPPTQSHCLQLVQEAIYYRLKSERYRRLAMHAGRELGKARDEIDALRQGLQVAEREKMERKIAKLVLGHASARSESGRGGQSVGVAGQEEMGEAKQQIRKDCAIITAYTICKYLLTYILADVAFPSPTNESRHQNMVTHPIMSFQNATFVSTADTLQSKRDAHLDTRTFGNSSKSPPHESTQEGPRTSDAPQPVQSQTHSDRDISTTQPQLQSPTLEILSPLTLSELMALFEESVAATTPAAAGGDTSNTTSAPELQGMAKSAQEVDDIIAEVMASHGLISE